MKNSLKLFSFMVLSGFILLNLYSCDDSNTHAQGQTVLLSQTGQTMCWDEEVVEINCAGTGHDGDIRAGLTIP